MEPRIYTYKITFENTPYWYWGVHKEKRFAEPYWGSPIVNRWVWDFYEPSVQILEFFPNTEEGWKQALLVEQRLILPDLNNPFCLNERCGPKNSLKQCSEAGKLGGSTSGKRVGDDNVKLGRGWMNPDYVNSEKYTEDRSKAGKKALKEGKGLFDPNYVGSEKYYEDRRKGVENQKRLKIGIFHPDYKHPGLSEEHLEKLRARGKEVWESTVDGFRSNAGNVVQHNKRNGWDPNARIRIS
jgi:hypothetical protein